jgi:diketogulonate reductase-like aldo/keto reductase
MNTLHVYTPSLTHSLTPSLSQVSSYPIHYLNQIMSNTHSDTHSDSHSLSDSRVVTLPNGVIMPRIGLGTYQMNEHDLEIAIPAALNAGYRLFDTAASYKNEQFIGKILTQELSTRNLTRRDVFITTKLRPADQGYEKAIAALCKSASYFDGYIDLYLIHWPGVAKISPGDERNRTRREETWQALQDIYYLHCQAECKGDEGNDSSVEDNSRNVNNTESDKTLLEKLNGVHVRAIGVSNFTVSHLESLASSTNFRTYPHVNQCELHLGYKPADLTSFCIQHSIHLQSYSSLGCGKLLHDDFLKQFPAIRNIAQSRLMLIQAMQNITQPLEESRKERNSSCENETDTTAALISCVAGVCLRWAVQQGYSIIPKSRSPQRIVDNITMAFAKDEAGTNSISFRLSQNEMENLNSISESTTCQKICWDGSTVL